MARELVMKAIDGQEYEFSQWNPTQSLKTLAKLTKLLGEPLTLAMAALMKNRKAADLSKAGLLDAEIDGDGIAKAVRCLIERMDEEEVVALVKKLTSEGVLCNHKQFVFDSHFGDLGLPHLFKVVAAALEVQYGNFIGGLTGGMGIVKQTKQQPITVAS